VGLGSGIWAALLAVTSSATGIFLIDEKDRSCSRRNFRIVDAAQRL
jgi:hypothetical protein